MAACGSASGKQTSINLLASKSKNIPPVSIPTSWVSESNTIGEDSLIQWVPAGGPKFVGTYTSAYISTNGRHIDTNNASVNGLISGDSIEITINGNQFSGTITSTSLSIGIPTSSGSIANLTFKPGAESNYNGFLDKLRSTVSSNEEAYLQQQALVAEQQSIQTDASTVSSDIDNTSAAIGQLQSDVQATASDLAQENIDLGTAQSDFVLTQQAVADYGTGSGNGVCGDASTVSGDASMVSGGVSNFAGSVGNVQQDITQLQSNAGQLQTDAGLLASAESVLPGYVPSGTPLASDINTAVSQSQAAINHALNTVNAYISTANSYQQQAYTIADQASSIGNCGTGPTTPSGLPAIAAH